MQIQVLADLWVLDPECGPVCRTVETLAAWLAESCEREWLW
jgi:hypothetical protein